MAPVAPRIVNDISHGIRIKHASLSAWQAQYLVRLEGDTCCSAHCKWRLYVRRIKHGSLFSLQAQYLVRLDRDTSCSTYCK